MMVSARAYSRIDLGTARLGNAWAERTWSCLMGDVLGLVQRLDGFDWVTHTAPGLRLKVDGKPLEVLALNEVEWSEFCNPFAAGLALRQSGAGLDVLSRFHAFHDCAGMLRTTEVLNLTGAPVLLDAALEILPLRRPGMRVRTHGFVRSGESALWDTEERAAAVTLAGRGLILGMDGGGRFELFDPAPEVCALVAPERRVEAQARCPLPDTFVIPFTGSLDEAVSTVYGAFLQGVRKLKTWDTETAAAAAEPEPEMECDRD